MPRQDSIGNAVLYIRKHLVENRTTRSFRGLLLGEDLNNFYVLSRRQLVKLRDLVVNAPHLPLLGVGGLAGIEKKLFGLSIHVLKNSKGRPCCTNLARKQN